MFITVAVWSRRSTIAVAAAVPEVTLDLAVQVDGTEHRTYEQVALNVGELCRRQRVFRCARRVQAWPSSGDLAGG
jgi:hypothetical protein